MESIEKHIIKYGLITSLGLIAFFFLMKVLGLAQVTELRMLNAIIMFAGVYLAIRKFKKKKFTFEFNYFSGIAAGFFTAMVTAVSFALFVGGYVHLNPDFLAAIVADNPRKEFLNPLTSAMFIFIEAIGSGFIFSLISMQYLKNDVTIPLSKASEA
ncbi:hypothetical protein [Ekhidna sp.]|uniref:hypothetical protein n=1 Tax=Ekhidna sp. TaxID=2608089 RepID=UPI003B59791D